MPNLNQCNLIGLLTRDPEVRYTPGGTAVADISLAINRSWKNDSGQKQEEVAFVDITFFGRLGEIAGQYLKKGSPAFITGHLKLDTCDDKQTAQKRSRLKVVGENLQLLGGRPTQAEPSEPTPSAALQEQRARH